MAQTLYELTPSQDLLLYSQSFSLRKNINNISTMIMIDMEIDQSLFEQAMLKAYERNDCFRLLMIKKEKKRYQYFQETYVPNILHLDFRGKPEEEMINTFKKFGKKNMTRPGVPLSQPYMFRGPKGETGIFLMVSHFIMDSWGICIFYRDVMEIYMALKEGKPLPKPIYPYEKILQEELAYAKSDKHQADLDFWTAEAQNNPEPMYNHMSGMGVLEKARIKAKNPNKRAANTTDLLRNGANHDPYIVPAELVAKMTEVCAKYRFSMQAFFLLGLTSFLSRQNNYEKDITIMSCVARRATINQKNTGGSLIGLINFRVLLDDTMTAVEALKYHADEQSRCFRHCNVSPVKIFEIYRNAFNLNMLDGYLGGSLTFQPFPLQGPEGAKVTTRWIGNGVYASDFYATVMDYDGTGGYRAYYEYKRKDVSPETIKKFHEYILRMFETIVANPDITIEKLLRI